MPKHTTGAVDSSQTVKAGCGIRYDPEVLGEETGFDFSDAERLKPTQESEDEEFQPGGQDEGK